LRLPPGPPALPASAAPVYRYDRVDSSQRRYSKNLPLREQQKPPITQRSGAQAKIRPPNTQKDAKGITTSLIGIKLHSLFWRHLACLADHFLPENGRDKGDAS
jgi:hypothetical protein